MAEGGGSGDIGVEAGFSEVFVPPFILFFYIYESICAIIPLIRKFEPHFL